MSVAETDFSIMQKFSCFSIDSKTKTMEGATLEFNFVDSPAQE